MTRERRSAYCIGAALCFAIALAIAPAKPSAAAEASADARAAIASAHPLATAAGHEILKRGGNAFDAAVAVAATLAVVEPYSSGLGGGGFWLLHRARDNYQVMVDAREAAPAGVKPELYLDGSGKPIRGATTQGGTAAAIPGAPAALVHVAGRYGTLPLAELLAPAVRLARDGFEVDQRYARLAALRERFLQAHADAARILLDGNRAPQPGFVLRQPELADTLELLANEGTGGFYGGRVAQALVDAVNHAGGVWQLADLSGYKVFERTPIRFQYRGATVAAAGLPSAGGIALAQSLNMLERFPSGDVREPETAHLVIEALRRAFHDRALHLGDSDFIAVPVAMLVSKEYAGRRAASIDPAAATKSERLVPFQIVGTALAEDRLAAAESGNTTHFSVVDDEGNRAAATLTINWLFGSGIVAGDTGVLINNEMDDFTLRPDVPNSYRLRGGAPNAVGPGKRPLSSMTPVFVEDDKGVLILGAPGGPRIVSQVLLAILDYLRRPSVDVQRIVGAPRYHHQWWPDRVEVEPERFGQEWRAALEAKGHQVQAANRKWGNMQVVFKSKQTGAAQAASDPRGSE